MTRYDSLNAVWIMLGIAIFTAAIMFDGGLNLFFRVTGAVTVGIGLLYKA